MADGSVVFTTELDTGGLSSGLSGLGGKMAGVVKSAGTFIGTALGAAAAAAFTVSIGAGMNFDSAMSQVAATMGKTVDEIQSISDVAKQLGETTQFTATEAAQAFNYLALAGYDAEKSIATIPTVLDLAAAGGMDLAYASDMITDSMSALGLSTDEAAMFADQMAKTATIANTSVSQLGVAILTVGGTAKYLSGGTVELNAVLGALADKGIKAEKAGTQLRNVITSLVAPTKQGRRAMKKLGVSATDAEGNMRPLPDIMTDLNTAMEGMSDEKRANVLTQIFNKEDLKSVEALLATTTERWTELTDSVENSGGAASTMATTMLDNLKGDLTLFKSAAEGLALEFYSGFSDKLRTLVQTGTSLVSKLTEGLKKGDLASAIMSILGEDVPKIVESLGTKLGEAIRKIPELLKNPGDTARGLATALLGVGKALAEGLASGFNQSIPEYTSNLATSLISGISSAISNLPDLGTAAGEIIGSLSKAFGEGLAGLVEGTGEGMESTLVQNMVNIAKGIVNALAAAIPGVVEGTAALGKALLTLLKNALVGEEGTTGIAGEIAQSLLDGINDFFTTNFPALNIKLPTWEEIVTGAGDALNNFITSAKEALKVMLTITPPTWEDIKSGFQKIVDEIKQFFKDSFANFWGGIFGGGGEGGEGFWDGVLDALFPKAYAAELPDGATEQNQTLASQMQKDFHRALVEAYQNGEISYADLVAAAFGEGDGASVEDQMAGIYTQMETVGENAKKHILAGMNGSGEGDMAGSMLTIGAQLAQGLATGITTNSVLVSSALTKVTTAAKNAVNLSSFRQLGFRIAGGVAAGIRAGSGAIAAALIAAVKNALTSAKRYAEVKSPSRLFRDELGRWIPAGAAQGVEMEAWQLREATRNMVRDSVPDMRRVGVRAAAYMSDAIDGRTLLDYAARMPFVQTNNFNVPVQTPDEFSETMHMYATYGLAARG